MATNVVFLIPGFLGFERFEEFAYFADRVGTAMRAILAERARNGVIVVPVPIPPTGSLAQRQYALGRTLVLRGQALMRDIQKPVAFHLLGHSTGGVDAHLLTLERPLADRSWSDFGGVDVRWLRDRLRSVISLASPHQGTCFASDPIARLFAADSLFSASRRLPSAAARVAPAFLRLLGDIPRIVRDPELRSLVINLAGSEDALPFFLSLTGSRALVDDLTPAKCSGRYAQQGPGLELLRRSFVTVAGTTPSRQQGVLDSVSKSSPPPSPEAPSLQRDAPPAAPDALFALLLDLTSGRSTGCVDSAPLLSHSVASVQAALDRPDLLIKAPTANLPDQLDAATSDGVVNTVRQTIDPADPSEIAGVIVADHFDVVGHYDRQLFVTDPKSGEASVEHHMAGLLHSGSHFRDDQFFALMKRIADAMMPALDS